MKTISKTHKTMMRLPPDFVELAGIEGEGTLTAVNDDGKEWPLGVRVEKYNRKETYCLSAGWMEFRRGNDICEGDECVFKFIRNEDKLLLARVIKSRRPARHPLGEKTENGAVKRKREQLEKEKTANGVVKRKREQPVRNLVEVPTRKVETRARKVERRAARGGAVASRGDESVKGVRRLRGKPAKQSRGTPAKQSRGTPARQSRGTPAKKSRGTPAKQSRGTPAKQSRGTRAKQSRGTPAKQSRSTPAKQSRRTPAKQSRGKRARRK
uniref:TF-B3 domain-containing protein n=1 Tax=Ambrosia artemisiifolia TaxID=4212 RepID=A0A4P8PQM9_AMBAR|nr:putative protein VRN1 [Ambrosia artemisiifolia]